MELKKRRRIQPKAAVKQSARIEEPPAKRKRTRKTTRTYGYRGINFLLTPGGDDKVRIYTLLPRAVPEYQCTVLRKSEKEAVQALAKMILAEQTLADIALPDEVEGAQQ